jgi:predicted nucleic acid-binding protein
VTRFVLDASVTLAWFIDASIAPLAARAQRLLINGTQAIVPSLWRTEVANGFVVAQRRGILTPLRCSQALTELDVLQAASIENVTYDLSIPRLVAVAQDFGLTAYDAAYMETARELQLPLATLDRKLSAAAGRAGVALIS